MDSNPYPIQIKKRILFSIIYGLARIVLICLIVWIFFSFTSSGNYGYGGFIFLTILFIVIIFGIFLVVQTVWNLLYLNSIEYLLDNKNLTFKGGVISRFEKVIPYSKIQHAIIYESFWQRLLGLSSVSIETAREGGANTGYGGQNAIIVPTGPFIPDLNKGDAEKLKNYIISVANKYKSIAGI